MQPVNSCQLLETSQKAKAFQDTQRLWPTAQGAGTALCSQLPFRFCALGAWQWQNHVGTWCGGPGAGALAAASSRMLISDSAWLFFFHFSFRWGWDSPAGKRKGKPQLIPPWYLDCSHWLLPAPCSQNSMEVQNWRWWCWWWWWINNGIFPESLRPGPLPALALLRHPSPHQLRAKLPRPLDRDFSTQWHYIQSVFPSAQTFFAGVLQYIPPPCRVGQLAGPPASLSSRLRPAACGAPRPALQGPCQGRPSGSNAAHLSAPAQWQSWTKTGSCCLEGWVPHLTKLREVRKGTSASLLATSPLQTSAGPGEWMRVLDSLALSLCKNHLFLDEDASSRERNVQGWSQAWVCVSYSLARIT